MNIATRDTHPQARRKRRTFTASSLARQELRTFAGECAGWSTVQIEREILKLVSESRSVRKLRPFYTSSQFDPETALRLSKERLAPDFLKRGILTKNPLHQKKGTKVTPPTLQSFAVKGFFHYATDSSCQDCVLGPRSDRDDILVSVVSDGVSSCKQSHLGAALLARYTQEESYRRFDMVSSKVTRFLSVENIASIHVAVVSRLNDLLSKMQMNAYEAQEYLAATVQTLVVVPGKEAFVFASGDGYWTNKGQQLGIEKIVDRKRSIQGQTPALPITNLILRSFDEHAFPRNGQGRTVAGKLAGAVTRFRTKREMAISRAFSLEGRAPYLVWQGLPEELENASLATDGVRFSLEASSPSRKGREYTFPLFTLLKEHGTRPELLQCLVTLFNLASLPSMFEYYGAVCNISDESLFDAAIAATIDLLEMTKAYDLPELDSFTSAISQHVTFHQGFVETVDTVKDRSPVTTLRAIKGVRPGKEAEASNSTHLISLKGGVFSCIHEAARLTLRALELPGNGFHFMDDVAIVYTVHP